VQEALAKAGLVPVLVKVLIQHSTVAMTVESVFQAITLLASDATNKAVLFKSGVAAALVAALSKHAAKPAVVSSACYAIQSLLQSSSGVVGTATPAFIDPAAKAALESAGIAAPFMQVIIASGTGVVGEEEEEEEKEEFLEPEAELETGACCPTTWKDVNCQISQALVALGYKHSELIAAAGSLLARAIDSDGVNAKNDAATHCQ
jgi:hypothetical protein